MNRNNCRDDNNGDYYRKRDRRDDDRYNSRNFNNRDRQDRRRSRSRSRDNRYNDDESSWSSSNRGGGNDNCNNNYDRRNNYNDRDRGDRRYDHRRNEYQNHQNGNNNYHRGGNGGGRYGTNYDSGDESDQGGNNFSSEPNNKLIVRGLANHLTEADIQCDLIQCGLKAQSVRLIRKKKTGESRGFAFVTFATIDEARKWLEMKQGVLILQEQFRAMIQYSYSKDNDVQHEKVLTDWYCNCGVFNFKRRENCFKCGASREESENGGEGSDEVSNILTKKIMLRNLDALTNEEKVLTALQERMPNEVAKVAKILICRDTLTQISRGICYLNFDNLVDSMKMFQAIEKLHPKLEIDNREVTYSYCVDAENRHLSKGQQHGQHQQQQNMNMNSNNNPRRDQQHQNAPPPSMNEQFSQPPPSTGGGVGGYQYTLADIPKLAEQAACMYATNPAERQSYFEYYKDFYTKQIAQNQTAPGNLEAHSGASIAQSAIERKQKMKTTETTAPPAIFPAQQVETPKGNDGKKYPTPDPSTFTYDENSGYYYDPSTNLYYDATSQYFYNSETAQYLFWDRIHFTYVRAPMVGADTNGSANTAAVTTNLTQPPPPPAEDKEKKQKEQPQDKVKVAKKIAKEMEKWAKQLNQKKDYTVAPAVQQAPRSVEPSFTPMSSEGAKSADVGFTILERKDRGTLAAAAAVNVQFNSATISNRLVVQSYHSDSDEDQAAKAAIAASSNFNESDLVDFDKLTCMLCKRAFPSKDVLSKHLKMSDLHKENLQKYKLQQGILDMSEEQPNALQYRDRAKERRKKYGEADPPPINKSKERFHREMEKQASIVQTYQASTIASQPISESNIGNKLLKKMGWKDGSGLGKTNQGRTEIIETEQRVSNAGLGSRSSSYGAGPGDDYKTYIKKMMKKRYEEN